MTGPVFTVTATIDVSADDDLSDAVQIDGKRVVGIYKPTTTSTAITFEASLDNSTFYTVMNGNSAYSITVATGAGFVNVDPSYFDGAKWIKIATGSNEGADRSIPIALQDQ